MANSDYKFVSSVNGSGYTGYGGGTGDYYVTGSTDIDLFSDVTPSQASDGLTDYRCIYLKYEGSVEATGCKVWFTNVAIDNGTISVATGVFNTAAEDIGYPGTGAPSSVGSFTNITTYSSRSAGLEIGTGTNSTMVDGDYRAIWLKREIPAGSPGDTSETYTYNFGGESTS